MTAAGENRQSGSEVNPLKFSRKTMSLLTFATKQEMSPDEPDIAITARVFAQVSIPYRQPKHNPPFWERRNGNTTLTIRPALLTDADGSRYEAYPYGMIPRQALTWMATEAYRTKSPELELGTSMNSFMTRLGLAHNGQNAARLMDNLRRLFGSQMSVEGLGANETGYGSTTQYFQIAEAVQLWFSNGEGSTGTGLWRSKVTLSPQFFNSIIASPVPLDLNAMRALGSSPMRHDMYLWLSYRMSYLEASTRITWEQLAVQFGAQYKKASSFRDAFINNLHYVKQVYPQLNVEVTPKYLVLRRSSTAIPQTRVAKRSKLRLAGDAVLEE